MKLSNINESIVDFQHYLEKKYNLENLWLYEGLKHIEISSIRVKSDERNKGVGTKSC